MNFVQPFGVTEWNCKFKMRASYWNILYY